MTEPTLSLRSVSSGYATARVLFGVSFDLPARGVTALLGRNGAGKTTLLNTIMGVIRGDAGEVRLNGVDVTGSPPERMMRLGVGYVPQDGNVFAGLSVGDNLRIGGLVARATEAERQEVLELFPVLRERTRQDAASLSGGERKMLAIARALLGRPTVLLLDEPTEGVWPAIVERIGETLSELGRKCAVLLVEQHISLALGIADEAHVLDQGRIVMTGPAAEVGRDPALLRYLAP